MSKTLYKINEEILACIDVETGEIVDADRLQQLNIEKAEKVENIALYVKNLTSEAQAISEEEKALAARRKAKENRAEWLSEYLKQELNGNAFETAKCNIRFSASAAVNITDQAECLAFLEDTGRDDCIKYNMAEIKKKEVGDLLKAGVVINGAQLETRLNINIK